MKQKSKITNSVLVGINFRSPKRKKIIFLSSKMSSTVSLMTIINPVDCSM